MWHDMRGKEIKENNGAMSTNVKLVLGVFSTANQKNYEDVIVETWWRQPGVCILTPESKSRYSFRDDGCSVYVAFIHGNSGNELRSQNNDTNVITLDCKENMNGGKSHAWFQ